MSVPDSVQVLIVLAVLLAATRLLGPRARDAMPWVFVLVLGCLMVLNSGPLADAVLGYDPLVNLVLYLSAAPQFLALFFCVLLFSSLSALAALREVREARSRLERGQ
jgi:hypothetical protein